jgi:hypothetical protein
MVLSIFLIAYAGMLAELWTHRIEVVMSRNYGEMRYGFRNGESGTYNKVSVKVQLVVHDRGVGQI